MGCERCSRSVMVQPAPDRRVQVSRSPALEVSSPNGLDYVIYNAGPVTLWIGGEALKVAADKNAQVNGDPGAGIPVPSGGTSEVICGDYSVFLCSDDAETSTSADVFSAIKGG